MSEKRRYQRVAYFHRVDLTVLPNGPTVEGHAFDISIGGIGVTTALWLDRGKEIGIRFRFANGDNTPIEEIILGRVAYSKADEDGNRLGIEFAEVVKAANQPVLARTIDAL